jgi:phosphatidate phosphatase APP1
MEFLDAHQIPKGPLMLRDLGLSRDQWIAGSHKVHKLKQIEHIFEVYPDLPFILIGDSGQEDPEIYLEAIQKHSYKVLAVYIRDIAKRNLSALQQSYSKLGVPLILVEDTLEAARHAMSQGWIAEQSEEKIKAKSLLDLKDSSNKKSK